MTERIKEKAGVQWCEWNDETFALARKLDKPILLDIGAVWCHWCHVMEETVYDDPEVARLVNELFIPIQVDTDRRPDINERYNQGGWPTTAFLTPEGDILYGATYVPKEQFKSLLNQIATFYKSNRAVIGAKVRELRAQIAAGRKPAKAPADSALTANIVANVLGSVKEFYDPQFGGFGAQMGNKFPQPEVIDLLLYLYSKSREKTLLRMVERTLEGQALGGMYDHVGGGFHRYSVRPDWRIPHFEKMLKDQAGHIRNYLDAYQATGKDFYREVAIQTLGYVQSVQSDPEGGFYGSQDADVGPRDDGSYFTWSKQELRAILTPKEYEVIVRCFGVDDDRNAMGEAPASSMILGPDGQPAPSSGGPEVKHVLNISFTIGDLATVLEMPPKEVEGQRDSGLGKMRAARAKRPTPFVDNHIFTDWNAMMVSSYLKAWAVLGDERYRAFALKTLARLLTTCSSPDTGMAHYYDGKQPQVFGLLADQVYMARALLDAYVTSGERSYLSTAEGLMSIARRCLFDETGGGFWDIASSAGGGPAPGGDDKSIGNLAFRRKSLEHNAVAADNLMRLWFITGNPEYRELQRRTLLAFSENYEDLGFLASAYVLAVDRFLTYPVQIVLVGALGEARSQALLRACAAFYEPRKVLVPMDSQIDRTRIAELGYPVDSKYPLAYICIDSACSAPVSEPGKLAESVRDFAEKSKRQIRLGGVQS